MAEQQANFVVKRRQEGTNEPEPKHPRTDDGEGPANNTKKLTDVVDDCLERIFMHLSLEDLLNIAHTNKDLKPAADMAFQRKFGKIEFELKDNRRYYSSNDDRIKIENKKTQLRLLRCFGNLITKLAIITFDKFGKKLVSYANEYCFDSLTAIEIGDGTGYIRNNLFQKPFANVEVVELNECRLYVDTNFKKWFPAMHCLKLIHHKTFPLDMFIVKNIPQLEHLKIYGNHGTNAENICNLLRNNPQLRSLCLNEIDPPKKFWKASQTLVQLECLQIKHSPRAIFKNIKTALNFPALKKLDICIENNGLLLMASEENLITFGQLKDITLRYSHPWWLPLINSDKWSNFFKRNQSIEKVTLNLCENRASIENIMNEIAHELPLLKEFIYFGCHLSLDQILRFIHKTNLMSYGFQFYHSNFDDLKKRLGEEWHASIDKKYSWHIKVNRKL